MNKRIALAISLLLLASPAAAQSFPVPLPPLSVVGNPTGFPGDAIAISYAQLKAGLGISGGGTPGGSSGQVQFNNAGAFGGISGATSDGTTVTLVAPILGTPASGVGTNLTALNATQLTTGTIPAARTNGHQNGTATNDNAAAGEVGEYVSSTIVSGSAVNLTTATPTTITSISLTAGDWDVWVNGRFTGGSTTVVTRAITDLSLATNTLDATPGRINTLVYGGGFAPFSVATIDGTAGPARVSIAVTTTAFFVAQCDFTVSTCTAYGIIQARRVR